MMGNVRAFPMAHAFSDETAYTADFYRTSCGSDSGNLGSPIEARFGPDVTSGNSTSDTMTIYEYGSVDTPSNYSNNEGDGYFKFSQQAVGYEYTATNGTTYYPSTEALVDFKGYQIQEVQLQFSEPVFGTDSPYLYLNSTSAASYSGYPFDSTTSEFEISIAYDSTAIVAEFYVISSGGSILDSWGIYYDMSGYSSDYLPPTYHHVVAVDELAGLEDEGYATLESGTDFQIESIIPMVSDFTDYNTQNYTEAFQHVTEPSCTTYATDDEGGGTGTWGSEEYAWNGYEAYQYVEVTDGSGGGSSSITVDSTDYDTGYGISGYYTQLDTSGYSEVGSSYTNHTFSGLTYGGDYLVYADNYAGCDFSQVV